MPQQILVIDDSKDIHQLVKAILAEEPVTIHSAGDAESGLVLAASLRPDLILLDVDMPGISGFDACRQLKNNPATAGSPVIFLTSLSAPKDKVHGLGLGAVDYVTKPFNRDELILRVRGSLHRSQVIRSLEQQALIDPLTELGNRAMFEKRLEAEISLRIRFKHNLSCILMDVDRFKEINDTYGHPIGDRILHQVSRIIADLCRTEDVACRYGGDEFVILTPHTNGPAAVTFAERMGHSIAQAHFPVEGSAMAAVLGDQVKVTASFGVAEATDVYDRSILHRADEAMYRSKQAGGGRVSLALPWVAKPAPTAAA